MFRLFLISVLMLMTPLSFAAEEGFSFDEIEEVKAEVKPSSHSASSSNGMHFFGKMDLTSEFSPYDSEQVTTNNQFKTQHFLLFLNAKISKDIQFQAEIIDKTFYYITRRVNSKTRILFGKIVVPFGESDRYHRLYGGNVNINGSGVMFPNIWAEKGVHIEHSPSFGKWDAYWVSGMTTLNGASEPVSNIPSNDARQAAGFRYTHETESGLRTRLSYYYEEWRTGSPLHGYGLDASYTWHRSGNALKSIEVRAGVAQLDIQKTNTSPFKKTGDYFETTFKTANQNRIRLRYGTYDNDHRVISSEDLKSWSLAWLKRSGPMTYMLEHQWNLEQVNEMENDILRMMVSVEY